MKRILLVLSIGMVGCSDIETIVPKQMKHIGCNCKDGTYKVQNYNLLIEKSNLTGDPCTNNGGILSYVYPE
jgi:hypothetical protein